jgi:hypothetical protein
MSAAPSHVEFDIPAAAFATRVRRDLIAQSAEIMIAEAAGLLGAVRLDDDQNIVIRFRRLDLAFRTAKACAVEIRDNLAGGVQ